MGHEKIKLYACEHKEQDRFPIFYEKGSNKLIKTIDGGGDDIKNMSLDLSARDIGVEAKEPHISKLLCNWERKFKVKKF